jgi:hypothetical protein
VAGPRLIGLAAGTPFCSVNTDSTVWTFPALTRRTVAAAVAASSGSEYMADTMVGVLVRTYKWTTMPGCGPNVRVLTKRVGLLQNGFTTGPPVKIQYRLRSSLSAAHARRRQRAERDPWAGPLRRACFRASRGIGNFLVDTLVAYEPALSGRCWPLPFRIRFINGVWEWEVLNEGSIHGHGKAFTLEAAKTQAVVCSGRAPDDWEYAGPIPV